MDTTLATAWLAELVLITYRSSKQKATTVRPIPRLALPSEYASTFIVYGALSLVPDSSPWSRVAGYFGWGIVAASLLNLWNPPGSTSAGTVKQTAAVTPTAKGVPAT
jgi:hypothetical protein